MTSIYDQWEERYIKQGYWPRRISPKTKACYDPNWQSPLSRIEQTRNRPYGIGLLMGSPFPDGSTLGALDIDRDEYIALGRVLLRDPPCGRIGQKGIVYFVRVLGVVGNPEFRVKGESKDWGKVAECLFHKKLCVIPPTIHPETGAAYR